MKIISKIIDKIIYFAIPLLWLGVGILVYRSEEFGPMDLRWFCWIVCLAFARVELNVYEILEEKRSKRRNRSSIPS